MLSAMRWLRAGLPPELLHRNSHLLGPPVAQGVRALRVAEERWGTALPLERPAYPWTFIGLVLEGVVTVACDGGDPVPAPPGSCFLLRAGHDHLLAIRRPLHTRHVVGCGAAFEVLVSAAFGAAPGVLRLRATEDLERLHAVMLAYARQGPARAQALCDALLVAFVHAIAATRLSGGAGPATLPVVARATRLIERDPVRFRQTSVLAQACGVDRSYLARAFHRIQGTSPSHYARRLVLARAAAALHDGTALATVAEEAGYRDAFAFSRAFTAFAGMPPSRWRASAP